MISMSTDLKVYLNSLKRALHLDPRQEREILWEIQSHVQERAQELQDQGMSADDSMEEALRDMGNPHDIAQGMYTTHSRTSWGDAALASAPHILAALYFSLHLWSSLVWVVLGYAAILFIVVGGWRSGRPTWVYPWLGYSLAAPVAVWFFAFLALASGVWSLLTHGSMPLPILAYVGMLIYLSLSLWSVAAVVVRVIRRDWILASLMALPFPFIATWLVFLQGHGGFTAYRTEQFQETDVYTALGLLALAVTTAIFCRMTQRMLRIGLLLVAIPVVFALVYFGYQSEAGPLGLVVMSAICLAFLLSPYFLESKIDYEDEWQDSADVGILPGEQADHAV